LSKKEQVNQNQNEQIDFPKEAIDLYSEQSLRESIDSQIFHLITSNLNNSINYLQYLNDQRSNLITISPLIYDQMSSLLLGILTNVNNKLVDKKEQVDIKNKCYQLLDSILVLSQTFYKQTNENEEKGELLLSQIKIHTIWGCPTTWIQLIQFSFDNQFKKQQELLLNEFKNKDKKTIQKILKEKENNIMKNTLLTFKYHFKEFNIQSLQNVILDGFIQKYNLYEINKVDF
jgi:hypothetical protein